MNCPRCHLALRKQNYEGVEVDWCETCWGTWLDLGELPEIVEAHELEFSDEERQKVLDLYHASSVGPRGQVQCPKCRVFMEQIRYDESIRLLIDRCPDHGVWLDAGELKKMQIVAEQTQDIQTMIVRKLKLKKPS